MYKFHYDHIKNNEIATVEGNNWRLFFTGTDILMYEIKTKDFSSDEEMFDFSNYSTNSKH